MDITIYLINIDMKLFELINTQTKTTDIKSPFDLDKINKDYDVSKDEPESGSYAKGSNDEKDPHMYSKSTYFPTNLKKDAYYQYITKIKDHIGSNPYFPRVYVIDLKRDSQGRVKPDYSLEKLVSWNSFPPETIIGMGDTMIVNFEEDHVSDWNRDDSFELFGLIVRFVGEALEYPGSINSLIKDESLKDAILLIDKIERSDPSFTSDLHINNCMIRGTSKGPQFVLMDPLWDSARESQIGKK